MRNERDGDNSGLNRQEFNDRILEINSLRTELERVRKDKNITSGLVSQMQRDMANKVCVHGPGCSSVIYAQPDLLLFTASCLGYFFTPDPCFLQLVTECFRVFRHHLILIAAVVCHCVTIADGLTSLCVCVCVSRIQPSVD